MGLAKVAIVTGCTAGGIGHAVALELHKRGAVVYATARTPDAINPVPSQVAGSERWNTLALDVTKESSISEAVKTVMKEQGRIDVLINNAGYSVLGPVLEFSLDDARKMFDTNVWGALACCQAVAPHMAVARSGLIVNMGSITGLLPTPWVGVYAASKAALQHLSESMQMELRPFGVKVMAVVSGAVKTNFLGKVVENADVSNLQLYKPWGEAVVAGFARINQDEFTAPDEMAEALCDQVYLKAPPSHWSFGKYSSVFWLLSWLPKWVPQYFLCKDSGLLTPRLAEEPTIGADTIH